MNRLKQKAPREQKRQSIFVSFALLALFASMPLELKPSKDLWRPAPGFDRFKQKEAAKMSGSPYPEGYYEDAEMPYNPDDVISSAPKSGIAEAKRANEKMLMAIDGVVGVGIGQDEIGDPAIIVYLREGAAKRRIPATIGGYPVKTVVTGEIDAQTITPAIK